MKHYEFLVGASQDLYGEVVVEADTLEEAKQKFFDDTMHNDVEMSDRGEIEEHRIVTIHEVDENGDTVEDGESEDQVKIPGLPLSNFERGLAYGRKDLADAEKRLQKMARELRDMQGEVYKAKLVAHVARDLLQVFKRDYCNPGGHMIARVTDALDLINGKCTDHDALRLMLNVSTSHISEETNDLFNTAPRSEWPIFGAPTDCGFIFHVPDDDHVDGVPQDLWQVLKYARNHYGCDYVVLDRDGFEFDGYLPKFEWSR